MSIVFNNKKSRRNYRGKARNSDDEDEADNVTSGRDGAEIAVTSFVKVNPLPPSTPTTQPIAPPKARPFLSFEDDLNPDDDQVFAIKKPSRDVTVTDRQSTTTTTKKKRDEKRAEKKRVKGGGQEVAADDDLVKVVGLIGGGTPNRRQQTEYGNNSNRDSIETLRQQLMELDDNDDAGEQQPSVSTSCSSSIYARDGAIPDAATIHLARKQREKAKILLDASSDSVSTGSDKRRPCSGPGRRLIREEDEDDEEDDDDDGFGPSRRPMTFVSQGQRRKLATGGGLTARSHREGHRRPRHVVNSGDDSGSRSDNDDEKRQGDEVDDDDEDDVAHGWERQQISKAMMSQNSAVLDAILPLDDESVGGARTKASSKSEIDPNSVTLSGLKEHLQQKFAQLSTSLTDHKHQLIDHRNDLDRARQLIDDSRQNRLPLHAKHFSQLRAISEYVNDLIECFAEKAPRIAYLERRSLQLAGQRHSLLTTRRRQDVKDLALVASGQDQDSSGDPKSLEAFRRRCGEREARRARRKRQRETAVANGSSLNIIYGGEGASTDDEEPHSVVAKRQADLDSLLVDANDLFADVVDEFCHLPLLLAKFAEWRRVNPQSYSQAYTSLCLPQLYSPLVRVQLIGWNPLLLNGAGAKSSSKSLVESMQWFSDLVEFASTPPLGKNEGDNKSLGNDEVAVDFSRLLPLTVERSIVKRLTDIVTACWDPLSSRQSKRLVDLVTYLESTYPSLCIQTDDGVGPMDKLLAAISQRIEETLQNDLFIPLYPSATMLQRQSTAFQFFQRQFNIGMKLLSNLLLWVDLLHPKVLRHLVLPNLVNRYLLVGLASLLGSTQNNSASQQLQQQRQVYREAVQTLDHLVGQLPSSWFNAATDNSSQFDQLTRFVQQLVEHAVADSDGAGIDKVVVERRCLSLGLSDNDSWGNYVNCQIKREQNILVSLLSSRKVEFEQIDISDMKYEDDKSAMFEKLKELEKPIVTPIIFSDEDYLGGYTEFNDAIELEELETFLKLPGPKPSSESGGDESDSDSEKDGEAKTEKSKESNESVDDSKPEDAKEESDEIVEAKAAASTESKPSEETISENDQSAADKKTSESDSSDDSESGKSMSESKKSPESDKSSDDSESEEEKSVSESKKSPKPTKSSSDESDDDDDSSSNASSVSKEQSAPKTSTQSEVKESSESESSSEEEDSESSSSDESEDDVSESSDKKTSKAKSDTKKKSESSDDSSAINTSWKKRRGGQLKTLEKDLKDLTKKLAVVGQSRLPGWGPKDSPNKWLSTLKGMAMNRSQWRNRCYSLLNA